VHSMDKVKGFVVTAAGAAGGIVSAALGGWDPAIMTLLICMAADYATGFLVAAVFHKSMKSKNGALSSDAGWRGLCKKGVTLVIVAVAHHLGIVTDIPYVREAVIFAFMANEVISLSENAALMGIPINGIITKVIGALQNKSGEGR